MQALARSAGAQPGRSFEETSATDRQSDGGMRSLLKQTAAAVRKPMSTAKSAEDPAPAPAAPAGAPPGCSGIKPRGARGGTSLEGASARCDDFVAAAGAVPATPGAIRAAIWRTAPEGSAPGDGRVDTGADAQPATSRAGRVGVPPSAGVRAEVREVCVGPVRLAGISIATLVGLCV